MFLYECKMDSERTLIPAAIFPSLGDVRAYEETVSMGPRVLGPDVAFEQTSAQHGVGFGRGGSVSCLIGHRYDTEVQRVPHFTFFINSNYLPTDLVKRDKQIAGIVHPVMHLQSTIPFLGILHYSSNSSRDCSSLWCVFSQTLVIILFVRHYRLLSWKSHLIIPNLWYRSSTCQ